MAQQRGLTLSPPKSAKAIALEANGRDWLATLFPDAIRDLAPHHETLWDWVWGISADARPAPLVAIWPRGGAKSTLAELSAVAIGARAIRKYGLYVCGTQE
ncbi:MAG: hypothetical protein LC793_11120, partial [Thermomicrobia bacterium]|nr:hypothetical protein [Thermomicrobia bacterium]